jgi:hypothetical protein
MPYVSKKYFQQKKNIITKESFDFVVCGSLNIGSYILLADLLKNLNHKITFFLNPYENNLKSEIHYKLERFENVTVLDGIKYDKFFSTLKAYDIGLIYDIIYDRNIYHPDNTYLTARKIGSYIAACLPILTHPVYMEISIFILKHDIGWVMDLDELRNGGLEKIKAEYTSKVRNLIKVRENLTLENELKKLRRILIK